MGPVLAKSKDASWNCFDEMTQAYSVECAHASFKRHVLLLLCFAKEYRTPNGLLALRVGFELHIRPRCICLALGNRCFLMYCFWRLNNFRQMGARAQALLISLSVCLVLVTTVTLFVNWLAITTWWWTPSANCDSCTFSWKWFGRCGRVCLSRRVVWTK